MRIALGVHVSTYEVKASLVDCSLPESGAISVHTVAVGTAPGGIAGAVSTALEFMSEQARHEALQVDGAVVVCENSLQREIVADAMAQGEGTPPLVVDIFDIRLSDSFPPDVSAALLFGEAAPTEGEKIATPGHRGRWPVAAIGAGVLAALGGVAAWAANAQPVDDFTAPTAVVLPADDLVTATTPVRAKTTSAAPTTLPEVAGPGVVLGTVDTFVPSSTTRVLSTAVPPSENSTIRPRTLSPTPTFTAAPASPNESGGNTSGGDTSGEDGGGSTDPSDPAETTTSAPPPPTTTTTPPVVTPSPDADASLVA